MNKKFLLISLIFCNLLVSEVEAGTAPSKVVKTSRSNNPRNAHHVVSGNGFTIEMRNNQLWAWGRNDFGQLGQGSVSVTPTTSPIQIGTADDWADFSVGYDHVIAIKTNGKLYAWGRNNFGQLGNGTLTTLSSPTQIGSLQDWVAIGLGANHSFAIKSNGTLWAWGNNLSGQLGKGTNTNTVAERTPVQIGAANDWASVSGGLLNSVATKANGTLWTWGDNTLGQLANGTNAITIADRAPVQVAVALNTLISIECGENYVMALTSNGGLYAWGQNNFGQLGDNSIVNKNLPTAIGATFSWTGVSCSQSGATGNAHTLAVQANGTVWSWGDNSLGQLGNGATSLIPTLIPTQIVGLSNFVNVEGGWQCSFARRADAQVFAWGNNASGNLGTGSLINLSSPNAISVAPVGWSNLSLGDLFSAAVKSNGTLWTWGDNTRGQLGTGSLVPAQTNIAVQAGSANNWVTVAAGKNHALGIQADGTLWAWGDNNFGQLGNGTVSGTPFPTPTLIAIAGPWVSASAGDNYSIAIKADGTLWAWGRNSNGQLGDGTLIDKATPVQIGIETNWLYVECGSISTIALKANGTLYSWGANGVGQLGLGNLTQFLSPQLVGGFSDWISVANGKGGTHALGIRANGKLYSWGNNSFGQLGKGTNNIVVADRSPVQIGTSDKWVLVSAGQNHSFGQQVNGTGWVWGDNTRGQLGLGNFGNTPPINLPTQLIIPGNVDSVLTIHCGYNHTGLIKSTRATICLSGANIQGQLGDGNNLDRNLFQCGVCAAIVPKNINSPVFSTQQISLLAIGSANNKILRVTIPVEGTIGTLTLGSLVVNYTGTNAADISAAGVKLWVGSANTAITQIGTAQSFAGGIATFNGLGEVLNAGPNYLWVTVNIAPTATSTNIVDISINAGNISVIASGGAAITGSQPISNLNPAGNCIVDYNYCVPTYSTGCSGGTDAITNVVLNGLSINLANASNCASGPAYYTLYNNVNQPNLIAGLSYPISITMGNDNQQFSGVWIDFNQDGDFVDIGEYISAGTNAGSNGTSTFNITVPNTAVIGNTRMRIRGGDDFIILSTQSCGASSSAFGETEDYIISIISTPICNPVISLNLTAIGSTTATLNWSAPSPLPANGYEYAVTTSPIPPGLGNSTVSLSTVVIGLTPLTTYYAHVRSNCSGGNFSSWTTVSFATSACTQNVSVNGGSICSGTPVTTLNIVSPQLNVNYTWSPASQLYFDAALTVPYILNTPATTVYAAPSATITYNVSALNTISGCQGTTSFIVTVCTPINNVCASAITLPVNTTPVYVQYSLAGATNDGGPSCAIVSKDVFFKVTVPSNGEVHVVTKSGNNVNASFNVQSAVIEMYSGSCGTLTSITCDAGTGIGGHAYARANGLVVGSTIFIRVATTTAINSAQAVYVQLSVTNALVWLGTISDNFNTPDNWHGKVVPDATTSITVPASIPFIPKLVSNSNVRGVNLLSNPPYYNAQGINLNGFTLNVKGNWNVGPIANASTTLSCSGLVEFNGTNASPQLITGRTTFGNLNTNNTVGGVQANGLTGVSCILTSVAGNFNANGNLVLKSSTANNAALVAPSAGTISGNVVIERKIGSVSGYHFLSSAVSSAFVNNTTSGWRDDFTINAALDGLVFIPGAIYSALPTVFEYDETNPNPNSSFGYIGATGVTDPLTPLKGFACTVPANVTVDVSGPLNNGNLPGGYNITRTAGTGAGEGLNIIGNPYASPISWNAFRALPVNSGLLSISGYQAFITTGGGAGAYGSWNGSVGTPASVSDKIASSQAILVTATATGAINVDNSVRLTSAADLNATFFSGYNSVPDLIRLEVQGNGFSNETAIYFDLLGQDANDNQFDAIKIHTPTQGVPELYSYINNSKLNINAMGSLNLDKVIPLGVKIQTAGTYSIVATDMTSFAPSVVAYLEDTQAGTMTNLRTNPSYAVTLPVGEINNRFFIHFHPAVALNATNETCAGNDGKLEINYPSSNTVNVVIKDENGNVVNTQNNLTGTATISNLAIGNYVAEMTFGIAPNTYSTSDYFTVAGGNAVIANLSASANTVDMASNTAVNFSATSQGASSFNWNFGDGTVVTNAPANMAHTYTQVGTYQVSFEASNGVCITVATTTVEVTNATGLVAITNSNLKVVGVGNKVTILFGNKMEGTGNIEVINMLGEVVAHIDNVSMKGTKEIDMQKIAAGQYMLKIVIPMANGNNKLYTEKVYLSSQ